MSERMRTKDRNRALAALDLILQEDGERAVFQLASMTPQAQAVLHESCRRLVTALEEINPALVEARAVFREES